MIALINTEDSKDPFTILGSGFCIDPDGIVVTCRHVLESIAPKKPKEKTLIPFAVFYNTTKYADKVVGNAIVIEEVVAKKDFDIAVMRIAPDIAFKDGYPVVEIGKDEDVNEGGSMGLARHRLLFGKRFCPCFRVEPDPA